ncbi:hypothetical protein D3C75_904640 [compost metagenome]
MLIGNPPDGTEHPVHGRPIVFLPVNGHGNNSARLLDQSVQDVFVKYITGAVGRNCGIHRRLSCHIDVLIIVAFLQQIVSANRCRRKRYIRYHVNNSSIHLLRPRRKFVVGTQSRLYMPHRNFMKKSNHPAAYRRLGVAVNQDKIRTVLGNYRIQPRDSRRGNVGKGLVFLHKGQIHIRLYVKMGQRLIQLLLVLSCHHHLRFKPLRIIL